MEKDHSAYENSELLSRCFFEATINQNIILLGDMNFHLPIENKFIYNNNFIDSWLELKHMDLGSIYIYSKEKNT